MASKAGKGPGSPKASKLEQEFITMEMLQNALKDQQVSLHDKITSTIMSGISKMFDEKIMKVRHEVGELRKDFGEAMTDVNQRMEEADQKRKKMGKCIASYMSAMEEETFEIKQRVEKGEKKHEATENRWLAAERDLTMSQFREMEFAVRIRGLKEEKGENLREKFVKALSERMEDFGEDMDYKIDKIYRVNSWLATSRKLPRDIVIYFNSKRLRHEVIQNTFTKKLKVEGQEVIVLKELPRKVLMARRNYKFLVDELKNHEINFRWELPEGVSLMFEGKRHYLNTVEKATEYYNDMFKSTVLERESEVVAGEASPQPGAGAEEVEFSLAPENISPEDPKEQRMTRAAKKKKEEKKQRREKEKKEVHSSEAVGGARSKISSQDVQVQFRELLSSEDDD